jgi:hypothetical protein
MGGFLLRYSTALAFYPLLDAVANDFSKYTSFKVALIFSLGHLVSKFLIKVNVPNALISSKYLKDFSIAENSFDLTHQFGSNVLI